MNLWDLPKLQQGTLQNFSNDLSAVEHQRLADLGFHTGEAILCLQQSPFGGPRSYRIGDSVFSLEREIALKILIG
jgi:Fe2+ transport system protein FeoA